MTIFQFILASLACYRGTVLIARDVGPWDIFKRLRKVAHFSKLLSCPFCVSIWLAALIEGVFYFTRVAIDPPIVCACLILSMSAISIILDRCFTVDFKP